MKKTNLQKPHEYQPDSLTHSYAKYQAALLGCEIEYADDFTLQLDLDSDDAWETFLTQIELLSDLGQIAWDHYDVKFSRSGNRHVIVTLIRPLPVSSRLLLQALLGSDLKREMLSWHRVLVNNPYPILLFRPKEGV